eukprot:m51a1_g5089 putative probable methionine--trna ligase-like (306) ;mRNA; f:262447-264177
MSAALEVFDKVVAGARRPSEPAPQQGSAAPFEASERLLDGLIAAVGKSVAPASGELGDAALAALDAMFASLQLSPVPTKQQQQHSTAAAPFERSLELVESLIERSKHQTHKKKQQHEGAEGGAKKKQAKAAPAPAAAAEPPMDISRASILVGRIVEAHKHPDADSLYVESVDLGGAEPVTVVSGLAAYVPLAELQGRRFLFVTNLKPVKMRGILSSAMILAASDDGHQHVEVVEPDQDTPVGERVRVEGYDGKPDDVLNPKKKIWEEVSQFLRTDGQCVATWKGVPLTTSKGQCKVKTLANAGIH